MSKNLFYQKSYPNLEKVLKDGAKIHISRSGGGLRVVSVEKDGKLISYGEYPYPFGALSHAETDFGLSYEEQYSGLKAKHKHYLTGAQPSSFDLMDTYVYANNTLDLFYSKRWKCIICITPRDVHCNRENEIHWGTSVNLIRAISGCLLSSNFEDKELFMNRVL